MSLTKDDNSLRRASYGQKEKKSQRCHGNKGIKFQIGVQLRVTVRGAMKNDRPRGAPRRLFFFFFFSSSSIRFS
jgi:hypothetical protein